VAESTPLELITATQAAQVEESLTLLSAAADPVRWTVLRHLAQNGTSCVCDLQDRVPVASNLLSYHLKVLRDAGLVTTARRGRWIDYTLADDAAKRLAAALPVSEAGAQS
jgi:ArsR family transcriptional regulator